MRRRTACVGRVRRHDGVQAHLEPLIRDVLSAAFTFADPWRCTIENDTRRGVNDARPTEVTQPSQGVPSRTSSSLRAAARRLLARELGGELRVDAAEAREIAAAAEGLVARVTGALSRSFSSYGAIALVSRALTRAQATHPVLSTVTLRAADGAGVAGPIDRSATVGGLMASAHTAGASAILEGATVWLAELADLLGELIGDNLARTILEQSATARDDRAPSPGAALVAASRPGDAGAARETDHDAPMTVDEP